MVQTWPFNFYFRILGFPGGSVVKKIHLQCRNCGRYRFDPWVGKFPEVARGNPFQYSCLENPMDNSQTRLMWLSMHACRLYNNTLCVSYEGLFWLKPFYFKMWSLYSEEHLEPFRNLKSMAENHQKSRPHPQNHD